jgi:phosphatidylethanolamine/phosphatidyl-N-methylethanolamine N-methyltransferase
MRRRFAENALFFREYLRNFHSTGAVLPSGRFLAAALARFVGGRSPNGEAAASAASPRRILEVGPGTGAVTRRIIARMSKADSLDLVELNETFVRQLQDRFEREPAFQAVADRARVLHCAIEDLPRQHTYDVIVSGLPLNNFSAALVEQILTTLVDLLSAEGTLSFFEYIAVRGARALVSGRAERARLRGVAQAMRAVLDPHEFRREAVWLNVPPAWVHHVRGYGKTQLLASPAEAKT